MPLSRFLAAARRYLSVAAWMLMLSLLANACSSTGEPVNGGNLDEWASGPVRWLLQPEERKQLKQLRSNPDAIQFLRVFWARRDPDPGESGNRFAEVFFRRVEAADQLYREGELRGALTDRGRALILLGPPAHMRFFQQPELAPELDRRPGSRLATREVTVEEWSFRDDELDRRLRAALEEAGSRGVVLRFLSRDEGAKLVEGVSFLALASRVAVRGEFEVAEESQ